MSPTDPPPDGPTASFPEGANGPAPDPPGGTPVPARFRPVSLHKVGGMGRVHRATDAELNREVAFKDIKPEYADRESARRRFLFEAEVTGRLEHPGVIPVYGLGRDDCGRPYYAMRFIAGQSL